MTATKKAAAKPAAKKTSARPPAKKATPAKKTTTKKAVEAGPTSSTAAPGGTAAGAIPAPAAQANNAYVHWNDAAGIARCGTLSVGQSQRGNKNRDQATCPACLPQPETLVHVHPRVLLLRRNIRKGKVGADFLASVQELGVLQPITAVLDEQEQLLVRFGERRVLAALEAGLPSVPVYVAGSDDKADAAEVDRIIRQRDENTHREGLTSIDDLHVVEQLVAFGIPAGEISALARMPKDRVAAAVAVSGSKLAGAAAAKYEALTLDQAAAVAEFEGDTAIAQALIATAVERPEQFNHLLQRQRDDRDIERLTLEKAAELEEKGVNVVAGPGTAKFNAVRLSRLVNTETGKDVTFAAHSKCPGHVAWIEITRTGSDRQLTATPQYGCTEPNKNGHRDRYASTSSSSSGEKSEAEKESARKNRRLVIDNNKAWRSAEPVRRGWLTNLAKAKTPPKGAAAFIVESIDRHSDRLTNSARSLAGKWLGAPERRGQWGGTEADIVATLKGASENRALHIALIQVLAGFEAALDEKSWRHDGKNSEAGRYLRFLESAGYPLSDVEKFAVSSKTAS